MNLNRFLIIFFVLIFGILVVSSASATNTDMVQYNDYFFGIDYSDINYEAGFNHYNTSGFNQSGECSSFFKDNLAGRSYDWIYDNMSSIVVGVNDAKYKNIGVAGRLFYQQDCLNIINGVGDYSDKLEVLPFCILDGINEAGVYCNNNMVPGGDKEAKGTCTIAAIETRVTIAAPMLPRFILDNFASAKDAVDYIRDYCNVINEAKLPLHTMIADSSGACFVLEYFDGKVWINENQIAMTNFYETGVKYNANGTVPTATTNEGNVTGAGNLTINSHGLERYNIIINDYDNLNTVDDFWNTLHKLRFTNCGFSINPIWASDLGAIDDPLSVANKSREEYLNDTLNRQRGDGNTWQSIHQCVYDLNNLVLYVETQEKDGYHVFELMKDTTIEVYGLDDLKVDKESEITVVVKSHGKCLPNTFVAVDIFDAKKEVLLGASGYSNKEGEFTFTYAPSEAGKQYMVVTVGNTTKTVDFEVSSNETSNQTVTAGTIPMQPTGNSLPLVLVLFILILSLGYLTYRKDNI